MFSLDDSTFPIPSPTLFADVTDGDVFRTSSGYFRKQNSGAAYSFTSNSTVGFSGAVEVQLVTAVLTITAP